MAEQSTVGAVEHASEPIVLRPYQTEAIAAQARGYGDVFADILAANPKLTCDAKARDQLRSALLNHARLHLGEALVPLAEASMGRCLWMFAPTGTAR